MSRIRRGIVVAWTIAVLAALTGCVSIPRSGAVVPGDVASTRATSEVEIAARPPDANASPRLIVEGFLQAMAAYEPDYATAREYLSDDARTQWNPTSGVTVYADGHPITEHGGRVTLEAPVTGEVDARGAYSPTRVNRTWDFGLVRSTSGQWRISHPPRGVIVSQFVFENFFQEVSLYWPEPQGTFLVPETVWVAQARRTPTALVQALLAGPGEWIAPAVGTAFPAEARLRRAVEVDAQGTAVVDLTGNLASLTGDRGRLLAGQLTWTLGQIPTITGVSILDDGEPVAVTGLPESGTVIPVGDLSALDPVPSALGNRLLAVVDGKVVEVNQGDQGVTLQPVPGTFGSGEEPRPGSLALAPFADRAAVVSRDRSRVSDLDLGTGDVARTYDRLEEVLRPQFSRYGELWMISTVDGRQEVRVAVDGKTVRVDPGALQGARIRNFRLSPDGVRMAAVVESDDHPLLMLARIDRTGDTIEIGGARVVPLLTTAQTPLTGVIDVGWLGAGDLVVLGSTEDATQASPYRLDQNAVVVEQIGQPDQWEGREIATLPTSEGSRIVVVGATGGMWRYEDEFTWPRLAEKVTSAAFPG